MMGPAVSSSFYRSLRDEYDPWLGGRGYFEWFKQAVLRSTSKVVPDNLTSNRLANFMAGRCGKFVPKSLCPYVSLAARIFLALSFFDGTREWEEFMALQTIKRKYEILAEVKNRLLYAYLIEGWRPKGVADVLRLEILREGGKLEGRRLEALKRLSYSAASLVQTTPTKGISFLTPADLIENGLAEDYPSSLVLARLAAEPLNEPIAVPYYIKKDNAYELIVAVFRPHPLMTTSKNVEQAQKRILDVIVQEIGGKPAEPNNPDGVSAVVKRVKSREEAEEWLKGYALVALIEKTA